MIIFEDLTPDELFDEVQINIENRKELIYRTYKELKMNRREIYNRKKHQDYEREI